MSKTSIPHTMKYKLTQLSIESNTTLGNYQLTDLSQII